MCVKITSVNVIKKFRVFFFFSSLRCKLPSYPDPVIFLYIKKTIEKKLLRKTFIGHERYCNCLINVKECKIQLSPTVCHRILKNNLDGFSLCVCV